MSDTTTHGAAGVMAAVMAGDADGAAAVDTMAETASALIDRLGAEAMQRVAYFVNRTAAQQTRRYREHWQHQRGVA